MIGRKTSNVVGIQHSPKNLPHEEEANFPHLVHVISDSPGLSSLKELHRQVQNLLEHVGRELDIDSRRQVDDEELPHIGENSFKYHQHQHGETDDKERIVGFEVNHLVGQQAPEHDRRQRQEAQNNRADRDIAHDPPLTKNKGGDEPDAERLIFVGNLIVALDENDVSAPSLLEPDRINDKERLRTRVRILQEQLAHRPPRRRDATAPCWSRSLASRSRAALCSDDSAHFQADGRLWPSVPPTARISEVEGS